MLVTYDWLVPTGRLHCSESTLILRTGSPRRASYGRGLLQDVLSALCPNIKSKDFGTHRALPSINWLQGLCVHTTTWSGSVSLGPTRHAFCMSDAVMHVFNLDIQNFDWISCYVSLHPCFTHSKIHSI